MQKQNPKFSFNIINKKFNIRLDEYPGYNVLSQSISPAMNEEIAKDLYHNKNLFF